MTRFTSSVALSLASVLALGTLNGAVLAHRVRTVALSGQRAPGTPEGVFFNFLTYSPSLNEAGETAFVAYLMGSSVDLSNIHGIWSEGSGSLELVARKGSHAPGTPSGAKFNDIHLYPPVLNDAGQTAFYASLSGNGVNYDDRGNWLAGPGGVELVARAGSQAPGTPSGVNYSYIDAPLLNDAGQTVFRGLLTGPGVTYNNNSGLWSHKSGRLELIVRQGDQAPGMPSGVTFGGFSPGGLNGAGKVAFLAGVAGSFDVGIWTETDEGVLELVARTGDPVGNLFLGEFVFPPTVSAAGQIAFRADLSGNGVDNTNDDAIFSGDASGLKIVAREGDHAPGTQGDVNFGRMGSPLINAANQTAFRAVLMGSDVDATNNLGIWMERAGHLTLIAREGSRAPGTPSGIVFGTFGNLALNAAGQIAINAEITGSGADDTNEGGIWATTRQGTLQLIARSGDWLEVAPSDFRLISALGFLGRSANEDGLPSGFNDRGQLAFWARFSDGSDGVFVSDVVAIPEPATVLLLCVAIGFAGLVRRSRNR